MDAKTLEALRASIAKWERNAEAETPEKYTTGTKSCALCVLYYDQYPAQCIGCPVYERTGKTVCLGSPYRKTFDAMLDWLDGIAGAKDAAHAAAREEVAFLKSLLPEGERDA